MKKLENYDKTKDLHWLLKHHPKIIIGDREMTLEERIKLDAFMTGYLFGQGRLTTEDIARLLTD